MSPKNLITLDEFIQEVFIVENLHISIDVPKDEVIMVPHYPYSIPAPDNLTVDEFLEQRINPIIKNHAYKWINTITII